METTHTPGPWKVTPEDDGRKWFYEIINPDYCTCQIANVRPSDPYMRCNERSLANANLIAAAPEMLEALQNIENDDNSIPKTIWDMIQNAIKKATP